MMMNSINMDDVRALAYKMWEDGGHLHGHDMERWNKAMEVMMAKAVAKKAPAKAAKPAAKKPAAKKPAAKKK